MKIKTRRISKRISKKINKIKTSNLTRERIKNSHQDIGEERCQQNELIQINNLDIELKGDERIKEKEGSNQQIQENSHSSQSEALQPLYTKQQTPSWYFSERPFSEIELSSATCRSLAENNYKLMTHIQSRTISHLLKGRDVLGAAKTGSGKTLAYLIPCMELLHRFDFRQENGTGVIIITPTRELAMQVYDVAKQLGKYHNKTIGLLMGGVDRKVEARRLQKGVNLLICTPGRLLDHLSNSKFTYHNLLTLVIDEADALLRQGFEQDLTSIINHLPSKRQTMLFSATQTQQIDQLAKLSLRDPLYLGVSQATTVENLEQGFIIISPQRKFELLFTFLRNQKGKKIMVFFSNCNSVRFYSDLLNYVDVSVLDIHGKQKQQKRSTTFHEFGQMKEGILLCTDVAARGLDIPHVDWIVQYDPPLDVKEYIHRVGRTCRGHSAKGKALLLLLPHEQTYLRHLTPFRIALNHYECKEDEIIHIQDQMKALIDKNHYLKGEAVTAFKSYLHAYTTYNLKDVFNVHSLDLAKIAANYGLRSAPRVQLNVKLGGNKVKRIQKKTYNY